MKNNTGVLGVAGENVAISYLVKKGYIILKRNYHSKFGEIDIIAKNEEYIIFAEVKTRKYPYTIRPMEYVDTTKQNKIIKTAMLYLSKNTVELQPRFDVIEILFANDKAYANHIKSAFEVEGEYEIF